MARRHRRGFYVCKRALSGRCDCTLRGAREDARKGVLVGYDHRYAADRVAAAVAEVISSTGTPVWLADKPCPTPAISLLVRQRQAAGGLVITASHNPYSWNGIKYKASYGSSALPSIVAQIEKELEGVLSNGVPPLPPRKELIHWLEPRAPYLDTIEKLIDWQRLRDAKFRFVVDPMHGSAAGLLHELFQRNGVACDEIRGTRDPRFGGVHPEPIEPHIEALRKAVCAGKYDAGFAADGDGDRIGAIDRDGSFVNPHQIFALMVWHLAGARKLPGISPKRSQLPNSSTSWPPSFRASFMKCPSASNTSAN